MVTKYDEQGLIVFSAPKVVDARASLDALAGRLDETKRRAALDQLETRARIAANDTNVPPIAPSPAPSGGKTAKVQIEELKRDGLQLELARKAGELVPLADVEDFIAKAIEELKVAYELEARGTVDQLQIDLNLSPNHAAMLTRRLRTLSNRARHRFATRMLELAGDDPPSETDESAIDDDQAAQGA